MPDTIESNQNFARLLGWAPSDFGAAKFDAQLIEAIRAAQRRLGVQPDGVCGPVTYGAWLRATQAQLIANLPRSANLLADAGRIACYEAKWTWLGSIVDPPSASPSYERERHAIDAMIRTTVGLGWDWEPPYVKDGNFEWCGSLVALAWHAAGLSLALRRSFFASTYRLDRWAQYLPIDSAPNPRPPSAPPRRFLSLDDNAGPLDAQFGPGDGPRAGDILLVGDGRPEYGDHITLVESYDAATGVFTTLEGNGAGALPDGRLAQGVVRGQRTVAKPHNAITSPYRACRLLRPSTADLAPIAATRVA